MKFALIGCGRIAASHLKAALENHLEIAAFCDLDPQAIRALRREFGLEGEQGIQEYADYRQMLRELPDLDLAAVTTASGLHARMTLDCIDAGVHVIVEKPMTLDLAQADEIIRRSEAAGVWVCACHQNRFNLAVQKMRAALEEGRFGKLSHGSVQVLWHRSQEYYRQADWRGSWAKDGGCLMNQCLHGIDLLLWMMGGRAVEVCGMLANRFHPEIEAEDLGMALVRFEGGETALIEGTTNVYPENLEECLSLFGQTGTARLGGKSANKIKEWQFADPRPGDEELQGFEEQTDSVYGNGHRALYADMVGAIRENRPPYVDARAGRAAVELILAIYKSARTGRPVSLPLGDFSAKEMEGFRP